MNKAYYYFSLLLILGLTGCTGISRGSKETLFSISDELRFFNADLGKNIEMRLHQKLLISLSTPADNPGKWTIEHVDRQKFLFLTKFVRGESALNTIWLYEARAYGYFAFKLIYTPYDDTLPPKEYRVAVNISNMQ